MSDIRTILEDFFAREKEIRLAYLFGSAARSDRGLLSDIDIAVLLDEGFDSKRRFEFRLDLVGRLCKLVKTDKLDLVVLNDAPLSLSYNVMGKVLFLPTIFTSFFELFHEFIYLFFVF